MGSARGSLGNFHTKRLSEHKVANLMQDTFRKVTNDQLVDSGPTKYATFRTKSKSIVASGAAVAPTLQSGNLRTKASKALLQSSVDGEELDAPPKPSRATLDYSSKYLDQYNIIADQSSLAATLDHIKCSTMAKSNPTYPL